MKGKMLFILLGLALASFGVANADPTSNATAHVFVNVDPNIAVIATAPTFNIPNVQTGDRSANVVFRIDANTQQVRLQVDVSALYKGDDCASTAVLPIPVNTAAGVGVQAANANAIGGHANNLALNGGPTVLPPCFAAVRSETWTWESSQNNHFSQTVTIIPTWTQGDPEKPMGQYSGFVRLTTYVVLPGATI